jgi:hypothetical protein
MKTVPTREQFQTTLRRAVAAGQKAGDERLDQLKAAKPGREMIDELGGACIIITEDRRSAWGRFLKTLVNDPVPEASVSLSAYLRRYVLHLNGLKLGQEATVATAAEEAAWAIVEQEYSIQGYVDSRSP